MQEGHDVVVVVVVVVVAAARGIIMRLLGPKLRALGAVRDPSMISLHQFNHFR
jgi:hypothetical protein